MTNENAMTVYKAPRAGKENKDVKLIQNQDSAEETEETSREFANVLGFGPSPAEMSEPEQYNTMLDLLRCWQRDDKQIFRCHFASQYLPQVVDDFLNVTRLYHARDGVPVHPIFNSPTLVLEQLKNNPYLIKYLSSKDAKAAKQSGKIAQCLAERLFAASTEFDLYIGGPGSPLRALNKPDYEPEVVLTDVCQLMVRTLAIKLDETRAKRSISPDLVQELVPVLTRWRIRLLGTSTGELLGGLLQWLGVHADWTGLQQGRDVIENLHTCHKPKCGAPHDLFLCAKCKTVLYCGRQHQSQDWKNHKQVCHQTVF